MNTDFDPRAGEINVVPQETGRVILNLANNAFYAVGAKSKELGNAFSPAVSLSTKKTNEHVLISVKDNGTGMSPAVREKIFQPFFSAKKAKGIGLGLSICERIIQNHGGHIAVQSEPGKGTYICVSVPA